jgi:hypothetical protein
MAGTISNQLAIPYLVHLYGILVDWSVFPCFFGKNPLTPLSTKRPIEAALYTLLELQTKITS